MTRFFCATAVLADVKAILQSIAMLPLVFYKPGRQWAARTLTNVRTQLLDLIIAGECRWRSN